MELIGITITGWVSIIIAISMAILAGLMFILGKERLHFVWGIFCAVVVIWAIAFFMVTLANTPEGAQFWWKIAYIGVILVPFTFFHFVLEFVKNVRLNKFKKQMLVFAYTIALAFLFINLTTNLIINKVTFLFNELYYDTPPGILHPYFTVFYFAFVLYAHYLVYQAYKAKPDDTLFRSQVKYFFLGTAIGFTGASMNFFPVYGIEIHPITNITVIVGSALIAYAILRYQLFNIRVVIAQLLTLIIVSFALIRLMVSSSAQEAILNILLLVVTLVIGVYIIISVRKNIETERRLLEETQKTLELEQSTKKEFIEKSGKIIKMMESIVQDNPKDRKLKN